MNQLPYVADLVDHFLGPDENLGALAAVNTLADALASYRPPRA